MASIPFNKCPKCDKTVTKVIAEPVEIGTGPMGKDKFAYRGVSYACSSCRAVLSVSIDPAALLADFASRFQKG